MKDLLRVKPEIYFVRPNEIMESKDNIIGCFVVYPTLLYDDKPEKFESVERIGEGFRKIVWGDDGIFDELKKLDFQIFGDDLEFILYQFYLNPKDDELIKFKQSVISVQQHSKIVIEVYCAADNSSITFFSCSNKFLVG